MKIKNGKIEIPKFLGLETNLTSFSITVTLQIDAFAYNYLTQILKSEYLKSEKGTMYLLSILLILKKKSIDAAIGLDAYRMLDYLKINIRYIKIRQLEQEIKDIKAYWS